MDAVDWVLRIFGVAAAAGVLWRSGRLLYRIEDALPTLLSIADQFKPNAGKSLHDQMRKMDQRMAGVEDTTKQIQKDLEPILNEHR